MDRREFLTRARVDTNTLDVWVDVGWLSPRGVNREWAFSEIDLARTRLIQDLTGDLGVNDDGVAIVLGLIDQLHGLRRALGDILVAIRAQPASTRERLVADLRSLRLERDGYATGDGSRSR